MAARTEVVVACIGVAGAVLAALIGAFGPLPSVFSKGPSAVIGPLQQELITISSEKAVAFGGLQYIARPPTQGGEYGVDVLLGGKVVASHEFQRKTGQEARALLTIENCNFLQLEPAGLGMGTGRERNGRTSWSMNVSMNIKTTCTF